MLKFVRIYQKCNNFTDKKRIIGDLDGKQTKLTKEALKKRKKFKKIEKFFQKPLAHS